MDQLPVTLALVARNEEARLPRCLDSVPWVSEVVAVVNDSSDGTRALLETRGARVEEHPWQGMAAQKNLALGMATQPWVLNLDADEAVGPALAASMKAFVTGSHRLNGATCNRCSFFMGRWIRHGDWYPDRVLRLFRRGGGHFEGSGHHDHVVVDGDVGHLEGDLAHYSFPSLDDTVSKMPVFAAEFARHRSLPAPAPTSIVARAAWRFFRGYVLRAGFLDGFAGLYIAWWQSFFTLYRYSRLREEGRPERPRG